MMKINGFDHKKRKKRRAQQMIGLKLQRLAIAGNRCEAPGCEKYITQRNCELHHVRYKNKPNERIEDFRVLCFECHDKVHGVWSRRPAQQQLSLEPVRENHAAFYRERPSRNVLRFVRRVAHCAFDGRYGASGWGIEHDGGILELYNPRGPSQAGVKTPHLLGGHLYLTSTGLPRIYVMIGGIVWDCVERGSSLDRA